MGLMPGAGRTSMPPCPLLKPSQNQCEQLWQPLSRCVCRSQCHLQLSKLLTSSIFCRTRQARMLRRRNACRPYLGEQSRSCMRSSCLQQWRGSCLPSAAAQVVAEVLRMLRFAGLRHCRMGYAKPQLARACLPCSTRWATDAWALQTTAYGCPLLSCRFWVLCTIRRA